MNIEPLPRKQLDIVTAVVHSKEYGWLESYYGPRLYGRQNLARLATLGLIDLHFARRYIDKAEPRLVWPMLRRADDILGENLTVARRNDLNKPSDIDDDLSGATITRVLGLDDIFINLDQFEKPFAIYDPSIVATRGLRRMAERPRDGGAESEAASLYFQVSLLGALKDPEHNTTEVVGGVVTLARVRADINIAPQAQRIKGLAPWVGPAKGRRQD